LAIFHETELGKNPPTIAVTLRKRRTARTALAPIDGCKQLILLRLRKLPSRLSHWRAFGLHVPSHLFYFTMIHWYLDNMNMSVIARVQTGVRLEKRLLKVLKALADYHDITLSDLLEGIVLHAFDGKTAFGDESLSKITKLKHVFGLTLDAGDAHRLKEVEDLPS